MSNVPNGKMYALAACWVDDETGIKHYDGDILFITTRFLPRNSIEYNNYIKQSIKRPIRIKQLKPSATSSLILRYDSHLFIELITENFTGNNEEEVKQAVEAWSQRQMDQVIDLLRTRFKNI